VQRSVKSAARAFDLLEVFERARRPMRVCDLVAALEAPQSSVSMLLKTMVSDGYLDFSAETREYCPSLRVANLCGWVSHLPDRPNAIDEAMQNLAQQTGETVILGRLDGTQVQYVAVIHSRRALNFAAVSGTKLPPHLTAIGIVLMGAMNDERIRLLLRHHNAELEMGRTVAHVENTLAEVALARALGYYQSASMANSGQGVIAALLPSPIRGQRYALGVGAPLGDLQMHRREYSNSLVNSMAMC
jgi:IclR family transcriptional regulator, acetate operon repressor